MVNQFAEVGYTLPYVIRVAVEDAARKGLSVSIISKTGVAYAPEGLIFWGVDHIRFTTIEGAKKTLRILPFDAIAEVSSPLE